MLPVPFLVINNVTMTSLLLLQIIYVLANLLNFLILSETLLFKCLFSVYFEQQMILT